MTIHSCGTSIKDMLEPGVSLELAEYRKKYLSKISYELRFSIPESAEAAITGKAKIHFHQARAQHGIIIDFQGDKELIHQVLVNGHTEDYQFMNGHIILSSKHIIPAMNMIEIDFTATDQAMNRSPEYMYTLFVPDRASTAFPCFDQPNLKASFTLNLEIPGGWTAVSNGPLIETHTINNRKHLVFGPDQPISTYLFAFAAGMFDTIVDTREGRTMTLYHRETNPEKLEDNTDRIFQQHTEALKWLESYTGLPYPFKKFDMVLIPGFQYSGMEHPGAIWYRDNRLLLDKQAPINEQLAKASLIAHETAHMWFGDLVTMQWFDDVWLKEVFAGFMADKIVHPQFQEINHELQFILTHFPRACDIDRSKGTHPIKQELHNMNRAGSLYGGIIYNKAPIVFKNLEQLMGAENFQKAVQEYLQAYYLDNADWDDLAAIFDKHSSMDIIEWSQQWVYGTGMPEPYVSESDSESSRAAYHLKQHELFMNGDGEPDSQIEYLIQSITEEENAQIMRYLINNLYIIYWQFLSPTERAHYVPQIERLFWNHLVGAEDKEKPVFLEAYSKTSLSEQAMEQLYKLYTGAYQFEHFTLSDDQSFMIIAEMKLREYHAADTLFNDLIASTTNPDRKRRILFLQQALSHDPNQRDAFFNQLLEEPANRRPEPWVIEGLKFLHHPLRSDHGQKYVTSSLEFLPEIQQTGDIFFPLNWLNATLGGYGDKTTAMKVEAYLQANPDLSKDLQLKVWQAADLLFRASDTRGRGGEGATERLND